MKKYIITIIAVLYSFLSANLLFAVPFVQSDLAGTWHMNLLRTGGEYKWVRGKFTIDSSGVATCVSMSDSTGGTTCPDPPDLFDLTFIMDPSTGVITQTGNDAVGDGGHMTMTSNKKLVVGTGTNSANVYQLAIMQKEVTGTSYSPADVQNKSFVYHMLLSGKKVGEPPLGVNEWKYGMGTTDGDGVVNVTSETKPDGTITPGIVGRFNVNIAGVVTFEGTNFEGFLSDDKKTIVGTLNNNGVTSRLMIYQITGQTYTAGPLPAGTLFSHMLGDQDPGTEAFWVHYTHTVDSSGSMTFSNWVDSSDNPLIAPPGTPLTGNIDTSGKVTINQNATFHGQVSHDGTFTVATQTEGTNFYTLSVSTKATNNTPSDFNSDGKPDIILRNDTTDQGMIWFMDGANVMTGAWLPAIGVAGWTIVGVGDFNADTKPDIILRNDTTDQGMIWFMDGPNVMTGAWLPAIGVTGWRIVGVGDFNADTKPDIILRNDTTDQGMIWFMDGPNVMTGAWLPAIGVAGWRIVGVGDFNADTKPDIILRNDTTDQGMIWFMDGPNVMTGAWLPAIGVAGWRIVGVGDFNADTKPDIILRNDTTDQGMIWFMDGPNVMTGAWLPAIGVAGWTIVGN